MNEVVSLLIGCEAHTHTPPCHQPTFDRTASVWCFLTPLLSLLLQLLSQDEAALFNKIAEADYSFDVEWWATVSWEAKDLISKMLLVNQVSQQGGEPGRDEPYEN